jgi:hypothetical protein
MWNDLAQPATASHKSEVGAASACPLMAATCGERWPRKMQLWPLQRCSASTCEHHEVGWTSVALSPARSGFARVADSNSTPSCSLEREERAAGNRRRGCGQLSYVFEWVRKTLFLIFAIQTKRVPKINVSRQEKPRHVLPVFII